MLDLNKKVGKKKISGKIGKKNWEINGIKWLMNEYQVITTITEIRESIETINSWASALMARIFRIFRIFRILGILGILQKLLEEWGI